MKKIIITITGQQEHITEFNRSAEFYSEKEAYNYLAEWLNKLNYIQDEELTVSKDTYYDTGDYTVEVEVIR